MKTLLLSLTLSSLTYGSTFLSSIVEASIPQHLSPPQIEISQYHPSHTCQSPSPLQPSLARCRELSAP